MTFDEWWNNWSVKDWNDIESAKNLFQQAFEAGLHADVHTDNSKVIADLEEKLANADYQLEGRDVTIKELEAQIEKMKCCGNCANLCGCGLRGYEECKNFDKWELREIKEK